MSYHLGRPDDAKRMLETAVTSIMPLASAIADPPIYRRTLSQALSRLAFAEVRAGRLEPGEAMLRRVLPLREELRLAWPNDREYRIEEIHGRQASVRC